MLLRDRAESEHTGFVTLCTFRYRFLIILCT